jgi:glycosyltransferase involved in cell wall biosynthesis
MEIKKNLVSIITPSYNQGSFIEDTILSIKNQTYTNIEHIIIDGGSTDKTLEIIKKYEKTYNLKWISEPDGGQADAIVKGFERVNGSIVTWLNTDDYYLENTVIEKVVQYFERNHETDVVTGSGYWVDEKKVILGPITADAKLITLKYMQCGDFILQPSTFFRRNILDTMNIEKQYSYVFDWLFFLGMLEQKKSFLVVSDFFSAYRTYKTNKTAQDNARRKKEIFEVVGKCFGGTSLRARYCYSIYIIYMLAEKFPTPFDRWIKRVVQEINNDIKILTDYRYYSC